jgi:hypothetical protein
VPTSLLMIERDSLYNFFEEGKTADNKQSFVATNSSPQTSNKYTFNNIANLIRHMKEAKEAGLKETEFFVFLKHLIDNEPPSNMDLDELNFERGS